MTTIDTVREYKEILDAALEATNHGTIEEEIVFTHPECTLNGEPFGREGDAARLQMMRDAFPDGLWVWDQLIGEGDKIAAFWTFRGTHLGEGMGTPTKKMIVFSGVSLYTFRDNMISEVQEYYDRLGLYQQLGLVPATG
jgi:predicted ester cyclase